MVTLLDTSSIIGLIVAITLLSANIAIILYIYQRKKGDGSSGEE